LKDTIKIGLMGTGFGKRVMLPAFAACEGAELVAVCSRNPENAQQAASEFDIPNAYSDYEKMLEAVPLDLVLITTPPALHWSMTRQALDKGIHILCEKPTAMNLEEASAMFETAQQAGVVHLIDHELRFHPTLVKMKALVDEDFLGPAESVSFDVQWRYPIVLERDWNWWFDEAAGGGLLGALGSHQVDLVRWLFGTEFRQVNGVLHNFLKERPDRITGELKPVTTDNFCAFNVELDNGAIGNLVLDATARTVSERDGWQLGFHGQSGSLILDGQTRLWAIHDGETEELTQPDPLADTPGLPQGVFPTAFAHFSRHIMRALVTKEAPSGVATFFDGMKVQAVLDAIRASHREKASVKL